MDGRLCVFCGKAPTDKSREHVLAQWLLETTGDPKRVVNIGLNFKTQKVIRFSWNSLVVPACAKCNSESGSALEEKAIPVISILLQRGTATASQYIDLLDWLDKVRIGLWLNYGYLQFPESSVTPNFYINDRLATKDRLLAVYVFDDQPLGLNAFGVESLAFHYLPSCFALRINNIAILNLSTDYLFAGRCGLPAPVTRKQILDGPDVGKISLSNFVFSKTFEVPLLGTKLIKPVVELYQPILMPDTSGHFQGGIIGLDSSDDEFMKRFTLNDRKNHGILLRQHEDQLTPIFDMNEGVEFSTVTGNDCRSFGEVIAQVYDLQNLAQSLFVPKSSDRAELKSFRESRRTFKRLNTRTSFALRNLGQRKVL